MLFSNTVIAAFVAIASLVSAAPVDIEARTGKVSYIPVIANNGLVYGSGNGGNGGVNVAKPVAVAKTGNDVKGWSWGGKVTVDNSAFNGISQDASGGDGSAVGSYGSNNHFGRGLEDREPHYEQNKPKVVVPVISSNGIVYGSGNGGDGGLNVAKPKAVAVSGSTIKNKDGWTTVKNSAGNEVLQESNGGDGSATGTYGQGNTFGGSQQMEARDPHYGHSSPAPVYVPIANNGVVVGSGNGGNGGTNIALPLAVALSGQTVKGSKGSVSISNEAGNIVSQGSNGGDGSAVGTFGSGNHIN